MATTTTKNRAAHRTPMTGRYARAAAHRGQGLRRRRKPEPTGMKKVLGAVLPAAAAKKAAPGSRKGKAGGLALVAAAAGMAFKNRDKLRRRKDAGPPPATPVV